MAMAPILKIWNLRAYLDIINYNPVNFIESYLTDSKTVQKYLPWIGETTVYLFFGTAWLSIY